MNEKILQHCAKCGGCTVVCPVYRVTGRESLTARGKLHLLGTELAEKPGRNYQDIFAQCLLCGACENTCPRDISIREFFIEARSRFPALYGKRGLQKSAVRLALSHSKLLEGLVKAGLQLKKLSLLPAESGLRLKLGLLEDREGKGKEGQNIGRIPQAGNHEISYFSGCLAGHLQPSIADATIGLCRKLTGKSPYKPDTQTCCGLAAWSSGAPAEARDLARGNIEAFMGSTGPILTSCASCSSFFRSYPDMFADDQEWHAKAVSFSERVNEFSSFFLPASRKKTFNTKSSLSLYYHEPCHLRFDAQNRLATHRLIEGINNINRLDNPDKQNCCGQGGLFHIGYPELSDRIFSRVFAQLPDEESAMVVTTCSGCLLQWQAGTALRNSPVKVMHLAYLLLKCLETDG